MNVYRIYNRVSGHYFGLFVGETPEQALDALARDAGYRDHADACRVASAEHNDLVTFAAHDEGDGT